MNKKSLNRKKTLRRKKTYRKKTMSRKKSMKYRKKSMKQGKKSNKSNSGVYANSIEKAAYLMSKKNLMSKKKKSKSRYTSIAKKIDKVIDSHFKRKGKSKKKSGTKKGPFSKKNPRVELAVMEKEASQKLINEGNKLDLDASKMTGIAAKFLEKKIIDDLNESIRVLKGSSRLRVKHNKKNFIEKSLLFWKMCEKYPKTDICLGKDISGKIKEYTDILNSLN